MELEELQVKGPEPEKKHSIDVEMNMEIGYDQFKRQYEDPTLLLHKSRVTLCLLGMLMVGLSITMIVVIFSVNLNQVAQQVYLSQDDIVKPTKVLGDKFKVPATNTFHIFVADISFNQTYESDKPSFKFDKT